MKACEKCKIKIIYPTRKGKPPNMPLLKKHPWLTSITLLLVLFFSLLPIALKYTAIYVLEKQSGQQVSIADIDLNLFTGNLSIQNIKLQNGEYSTHLAKFHANLSLRDLFQKQLLFSQIQLSGVTLPIEVIQGETQEFKVAGFAIPQSSDKEDEPTAGLPIGVGVQQLQLEDINLQLIQAGQQQLYQIRSLSLNELYSWDSDFARLKLNSALNQKSINANLQVNLFAKVPHIIGTVKVRELNLHDLQDWVKQPLSGQLSAEMTFTIEKQSNGFNLYQYSDINLQDADIQLEQQQIRGQALSWQGDAHYFAGDVQGIKVLGKLNGQQLEFTQADDNGGQLNLKTNINSGIDLIGHLDGPDAKIQQNGSLTLSDFALQQTSIAKNQSDLAVDYQKLSYQGEVNYALTQPKLNLNGKLTLEQLLLKQQQQSKTAKQNLEITYPKVTYQGSVGYAFDEQNINLNGKLQGEKLQLTQQVEADKKQQSLLNLALVSLDLDGKQQIQLGDTIDIATQSDLALTQLSLTQENNSGEGSSKLQLSNNLNAKLNLKANFAEKKQSLQQSGAIRINNLDFQQNDIDLKTPAINWNGKINWQQTDAMQLSAKGDLNGKQLQFKQQNPESKLQLQQSLQAQLDLELKNNDKQLSLQQTGVISLNDLNLQQQGLQQLAQLIRYDGTVNFVQTQPTENQPESATQDISLQGKLALQNARTELPEQQIKIAQNLNSDFTLNTNIQNETLRLDYQGSGQIKAFNFKNAQQTAAFNTFNWRGKTSLQQNLSQTEQKPKLSGQLKLSANRIKAGSPTFTQAVQLEQLSLPSLTLKGIEHFAFKELQLSGLDLQGVENRQAVPVAAIKTIRLNQGDIAIAPELNVRLGDLTIDDLGGEVNVDKDYKVIQVNALLAAFGIEAKPAAETDGKAEKTEQTPVAEEDSASELPKIALASFALQGSNQIQFNIANPVNPEAQAINKKLDIKKLQFSTFDSNKPDQESQFEFLANLDEFSEIRSSGTIAPLAKDLSLQAKTAINGLALNDFSPLVQQAVGYKIDSGQLSATIDSKIAANKIDVENEVKLYKFELSSADQEKTDEFNKGFSMPLEVGLSLLRDKNDNIELKLPIKGDLDNPDFSIQDIVSTALNGALGKATRTYLLLALQPFGAIALVGEMALDQATAVRLQPVDFEDASFKLSAEMDTYLQKVATLLKSKTDVQIKLCGGINQSDKQKIAVDSQTDSQKKEGVLPKISDDQLLRLATMRQTMIKRHLLEQGVSTNQIVICQPKIGDESGAAKVQMGI